VRSAVTIALCGIKFFFEHTLQRQWVFFELARPPKEKKLPVDGQRALGNPILGPRALFIDGPTMWLALREGHSVWRMELAEGRLRHVAGTGQKGFTGDGGPPKSYVRAFGPRSTILSEWRVIGREKVGRLFFRHRSEV